MDLMALRSFVICLFFSFVGGWFFRRVSNKVCYGTLGCFSKKYPFTNTKGILPRPPDVIGTKFLLFTRNTTQEYEELVLTDGQKKCAWKSFYLSKQIKLVIHGYMASVEEQWLKDMVEALVEHDDYNVVFVDWRKGAREINYLQAVANTRVVGAHVAQLLKVLKNVYDIDPKNVHIIGHSLGAHTAGYVGEYLESIGRITGLGLKQQIGRVDFYPNGGRDQPGCPTTFFAQIRLLFSGNFHTFACSHLRAIKLFTESINSECQFNAYPCEFINNKSPKQCRLCKTGCGIMGLHTNTSMNPGMYFLETGSDEPYCVKKDALNI